MNGKDPLLVGFWEERWHPPTIIATCPACGERKSRRASSWAEYEGGRLWARFRCSNRPPQFDDCFAVFDIEMRTR